MKLVHHEGYYPRHEISLSGIFRCVMIQLQLRGGISSSGSVVVTNSQAVLMQRWQELGDPTWEGAMTEVERGVRRHSVAFNVRLKDHLTRRCVVWVELPDSAE